MFQLTTGSCHCFELLEQDLRSGEGAQLLDVPIFWDHEIHAFSIKPEVSTAFLALARLKTYDSHQLLLSDSMIPKYSQLMGE